MRSNHQQVPNWPTDTKSHGFAALLCFVLLAGCARGDWPSLSDRLPDPQDRVLVRGEPSANAASQASSSPRPGETTATQIENLTETDAIALLRAVRAEVKSLQAEYTEAAAGYDLAAIPPQAGSRQELRHMWMNLQLQLTRVSQSARRLNDILFARNPLDTSLVKEANTLKASVQDFVAVESVRRPAPDAG